MWQAFTRRRPAAKLKTDLLPLNVTMHLQSQTNMQNGSYRTVRECHPRQDCFRPLTCNVSVCMPREAWAALVPWQQIPKLCRAYNEPPFPETYSTPWHTVSMQCFRVLRGESTAML